MPTQVTFDDSREKTTRMQYILKVRDEYERVGWWTTYNFQNKTIVLTRGGSKVTLKSVKWDDFQ